MMLQMIKAMALFLNFPVLNNKLKKNDGNLFFPLFLGWSIHGCMIKSGSVGSVRSPDQGLFLTFLMDLGPSFGWNTFLKFENPSTGSKVRLFQTFLAKNFNFWPKNLSFLVKTCIFWLKFEVFGHFFLELSNF